jgi:outer membrane biosynthesis protein TonB
MSKAKTNALDALRALIAERQQYEQWLSTLEARREGTPEHVFERVQTDYKSRLDRVVGEIRGHAEELQLSISTLSSRLVEVAREEDTRREGLQEAELRAAVGEYEPGQWDQLRAEAEQALERIGADRKSLDDQLGELRSIQKLSESGPQPEGSAGTAQAPAVQAAAPQAPPSPPREASPPPAVERAPAPAAVESPPPPPAAVAAPVEPPVEKPRETPAQERLPLAEPVAQAASAAVNATSRPRSNKTPPGGMAAARAKSEAAKPDAAKTLKCPECGTPNYPTEWYCERCGGELATV